MTIFVKLSLPKHNYTKRQSIQFSKTQVLLKWTFNEKEKNIKMRR